jgi:hypothetical protein
MHSAIVVMNMPEKHESEGHHPKWVPAWRISVEHPNRWSDRWKIKKVF